MMLVAGDGLFQPALKNSSQFLLPIALFKVYFCHIWFCYSSIGEFNALKKQGKSGFRIFPCLFIKINYMPR